MMGYRRAAAALHGLSGNDREWILSALPNEEGQHVKKYLEELNELGFAEGMLSGEIPTFLQRTAQAGDDRSSDVLRTASAMKVFAVLEAEPASLVGRLLAIRNWPWRDDLLKIFPPAQRERVRSAMNGGSPAAPALEEFLVETLAARLKTDAKGIKRKGIKRFTPIRKSDFGRRWLARLSSSFSRMVRLWSR